MKARIVQAKIEFLLLFEDDDGNFLKVNEEESNPGFLTASILKMEAELADVDLLLMGRDVADRVAEKITGGEASEPSGPVSISAPRPVKESTVE